ncbi:MAG TPA: hypothetical protein PLG50_10960 [bacterium]|nr:hypothetical protein [bacterium]HQG46165.1 hypothetical protein [bacterium]HQJ63531.1 hypothetical protein [bacterium]
MQVKEEATSLDLLGLVIGADTRQVMSAAAPVFAVLADGIVVVGAEPMAIVLNPIHDIGVSGISLNPAAFTPLVDQDFLDLDLHILAHTAIKYPSFLKK